MQAKNMDELNELVRRATKESFDGASLGVQEDMQNSIQKYVYDAYTPNKYNRTGQLKEAYQILHSGATKSMHSVLLGFDFGLMTADPAEYRHYSPIYGTPFITGLPEAIQQGKTGASGFFGAGGFSKPRDFMQDYYRTEIRFVDTFIELMWENTGLTIRQK